MTEIAGSGWKWLKKLSMAEMAENGWNGWNWLKMAGNSRKKLKMVVNGWNGFI